LQSKFRDFFERSNPHEPDTRDTEIPCLTERFILGGKSANNMSKEELRRAVFELMSLTFIECGDDVWLNKGRCESYFFSSRSDTDSDNLYCPNLERVRKLSCHS
jgi:hypothetical protein